MITAQQTMISWWGARRISIRRERRPVHHLVVSGVAGLAARVVITSSRGAAHLSECQAVQASRAASGSSAKQAMASASAYGSCGAADIVSNHASMHRIAAVAAAAG